MPTLRALVLLAPLTLAGAMELLPINDLRVGVAIAWAPKVEERVRTAGYNGDYDLEGNRGMTLRYQADYLNGMSRRGVAQGGLVWGGGLLYSDTDIRPKDYALQGGLALANARKMLALRYRQYGASLYLGYATQPTITEYGEWNLEFLPVVRGGYAWAETVDGANDRTEAGGGKFYEAGGLVGWTLQDKGWLLNLNGGWTYGVAEVPIDITGGTSRLRLVRNGPEAALTVGARF